MATPTQTPAVNEVEDLSKDTFVVEMEGKGALVLQESQAITKIENNDQYTQVCARLKDAAANIKLIEGSLAAVKEKRYAAWKRVTTIQSKLTAPFEQVKERDGRLVAIYQREMQEQRQREEEKERQRLAEQARKDQQLQANNLADEGRVEEGLVVLEQEPVQPMTAVVGTSVAPKVKGIGNFKTKYTAEVFDKKALLQGIIDGKVPILAVVPDQKWLDKQADNMKDLLQYPGVRLKKLDVPGSVRA